MTMCHIAYGAYHTLPLPAPRPLLFFEERLAAEADLVALDVDAFDQDLLALFQFVADVANAVIGDLRNVEQSFGTGEDLDEGAEIDDAGDGAEIALAHLDFGRQVANDLHRGLGGLAVRRGDGDSAVVRNVDLRAGLLLDAANDLAARADDVANLVGVDLHRDDARRVFADLLARLGDDFVHLVEDEHPPLSGLLQSLGQNLGVQSCDLDVHLERRDSLARPGDFEIHIAVMVLGAGDVGQDGVFLVFHHQTHGHARDRRLDRHAGVHQRERAAADRGHRGRAVRFGDVGNDADGVGEDFFLRHHGVESALRQGSVTDLAPSGGAHAARFADRERREIIVEHEAAFDLAQLQTVDVLHVLRGAERRRDKRLGLAAGEERRTMSTREPAGFDRNRADLGELAAVGTAAVVQNVVAEYALFQIVEQLAGLVAQAGLVFGIAFDDALLQFVNRVVALELALVLDVQSFAQIVRVFLGDLFQHDFVDRLRSEFALLDSERVVHRALQLAELPDLAVGEHQSFDHHLFTDLFGAALDHHDRLFASRDDQVER